MFLQSQARAGFLERLRTTLFLRRLPVLASLLLLAGVIQGCAPTPTALFAGPDPSDASARNPALSYHWTIDSFASPWPVEPGLWKERAAEEPRSEHQ